MQRNLALNIILVEFVIKIKVAVDILDFFLYATQMYTSADIFPKSLSALSTPETTSAKRNAPINAIQ